MYKAFIFDFDGVLVDTTDIQVRSIVRALGRNGFDIRHPSDLDIVHSTITTKAKLVKFCDKGYICLLYTSPSPRDRQKSRMPSSA